MSQRRLATLLLSLLVAVFLYLLLRQFASLEQIADHEQRLRDAVRSRPVASAAVGLLVYVAASLIPGTTGKSLVYGWLFGAVIGTLLVNVGLTIAAVIAFLLSRYLFRGALHRRFHGLMRRIDRGLRAGEGMFLLSLRLLHAPYTATNYAIGATDVSVRRFWWTTQLGLLPGNVAFVYAGAGLPSLSRLAEEGVWSFINFPLLAGLTVVTILPAAIRWIVRRHVPEADARRRAENADRGETRREANGT